MRIHGWFTILFLPNNAKRDHLLGRQVLESTFKQAKYYAILCDATPCLLRPENGNLSHFFGKVFCESQSCVTFILKARKWT